jgi:CheY-like chemotaxis protein
MTEMPLRTCLLVTDDSDDHQSISEAISQISEKTVVLNVLDSQMALLLLREKESKYQPDYIFLDLSMHGLRINSLLKSIRNEDGFFKSPVVVYGDIELFNQIDNAEHLIFFSKDYQYSELLDFLRTIFNP